VGISTIALPLHVVKRMTSPYPNIAPRYCLPKIPVQVEVVRKRYSTGAKRRRKPKCHLRTELQVLSF